MTDFTDISVTFTPGVAGTLAMVRKKLPGRPPEFRNFLLRGTIEDSIEELLAFIWAHVDGPHIRQGWLWET